MIFVKGADGKLKPLNQLNQSEFRSHLQERSDIPARTLARYAIELIFLACAFLFIFYGLPVLITLIFGES